MNTVVSFSSSSERDFDASHILSNHLRRIIKHEDEKDTILGDG